VYFLCSKNIIIIAQNVVIGLLKFFRVQLINKYSIMSLIEILEPKGGK